VVCESNYGPEPLDLVCGALDDLAGILVDDVEDLAEWTAFSFVDGPAGEALRNSIHLGDERVGVGDDDGIADAGQNAGCASFAFAEVSRCDDLVGDVVADDEDAVDCSQRVVDGAVAVGPVDILKTSVAKDGDQDFLFVDCLAVCEDGFELWSDEMPGLLPALPCRLAESRGVLVGHEGAVLVVVELQHVRSPEDDRGELAGEHEIDGREKRVGPGLDGAQGRGSPVVSPDEICHLPCTGDAPSWLGERALLFLKREGRASIRSHL